MLLSVASDGRIRDWTLSSVSPFLLADPAPSNINLFFRIYCCQWVHDSPSHVGLKPRNYLFPLPT